MSWFDRMAGRSDLERLAGRAAAAESEWRRSGAESSLDDAVDAYRAFLDDRRVAGFPEQHAWGLIHCARLLTRRAAIRGVADVDEALLLLDRARGPAVGRRRASIDMDLGTVHRARYRLTRSRADLDASRDGYQRVLDADDPHPDDRRSALLVLAEVLLERVLRWHDTADVEQVRALADAAAGLTDLPADGYWRAQELRADALLERCRLLREAADPADLDQAVAAYGAALESLPDGRTGEAGRVQENLALAYEMRFQARRSPADLDRCIELLEAAVAREA